MARFRHVSACRSNREEATYILGETPLDQLAPDLRFYSSYSL